MITLTINKKELDLIKSGKKRIEFRQPSLFNKRKLLILNEDRKFTANQEPGQITFIAGRTNAAERYVCAFEKILPIKFSQNYTEFEGEVINATAGECIIAIYLKP